MQQMNLFDQSVSPPPPPSPYAPGTTPSYSGNRWHEVCESRMSQYAFRKVHTRYMLGGVLEFDGLFVNAADLQVLAEYKERIDQRIFKELVGQARLGRQIKQYSQPALLIIVLAGYIDSMLLSKETMINAASDDIFLIANPQHKDAEKYLRNVAIWKFEKANSMSYPNLTRRIAAHGGFGLRPAPIFLQ